MSFSGSAASGGNYRVMFEDPLDTPPILCRTCSKVIEEYGRWTTAWGSIFYGYRRVQPESPDYYQCFKCYNRQLVEGE